MCLKCNLIGLLLFFVLKEGFVILRMIWWLFFGVFVYEIGFVILRFVGFLFVCVVKWSNELF